MKILLRYREAKLVSLIAARAWSPNLLTILSFLRIMPVFYFLQTDVEISAGITAMPP